MSNRLAATHHHENQALKPIFEGKASEKASYWDGGMEVTSIYFVPKNETYLTILNLQKNRVN